MSTFKPTHGMSCTKIYGVWEAMRRRCEVEADKSYSRYGGRGITVCERWHSFENFMVDMGLSNGLQIERLDNDKGYCKENCVWATPKEQARNRRSSYILTYQGITCCLAEHCERLGLDYYKTHQRLYTLKWSVERAFEE